MNTNCTFNPGDLVQYDTVSDCIVSEQPATKPGHIVLKHDLIRISAVREVIELNPGRELVPGQLYTVRRSTGELEGGWEYLDDGVDYARLVKIGGLLTVPLSEVEHVSSGSISKPS